MLLDLAGLLPDPTPDAVRRQAGRLTPGLVRAICAVETPQRTLLASAGYGEAVAPVGPGDIGHGVRAGVQALCTVTVDDGGDALVAAAYTDGAIRLWNPADGQPVRQLNGHRGSVNALCAVGVGDSVRLASAAGDGTVCGWDLDTGEALGQFDDSSPRYALCPVESDGEILVAAAGDGVGISLFDPVRLTRRGSLGTGPVLQMLLNPRPTGWIRSMCQVGSGDDAFLMFAGYYRAVGQIRLRPALRALEEDAETP